MTGVAVFMVTPSAPWHVLQTSNLAPRMAAASAAFPGVGSVVSKQEWSSEFAVGLGFRRVLFFFQAEDGIRDHCVTGVQTCALPIFFGVLCGFVETASDFVDDNEIRAVQRQSQFLLHTSRREQEMVCAGRQIVDE